jgi:hypothetical protein
LKSLICDQAEIALLQQAKKKEQFAVRAPAWKKKAIIMLRLFNI